MQNETHTQRLIALDGIRGLAIFLVIFNHIPLTVLYSSLPNIVHPFITILLTNGKTGVSLLFLLSGFLMTWLYPQPKSAIAFWAKRYARVFPPFLVMVVSLAIIRSHKIFLSEAQLIEIAVQPWRYGVMSVGVILGVGILARGLWQLGVALNKKISIGKPLFLVFLGLQVAVAAWYSLILLRVPPAEFYTNWTKTSQMIATAFVNGTLTLPFGQYIAQLDGVYWSLITEILFYLLYPILIVPLLGALLKKNSTKFSVLVLLSLLPFFFGLKLVSDRVLGFSIMQIHLFSYFIAGMTLAIILRKKEEWKEKVVRMLPAVTHPISIIGGLALLFSSVLLYDHVEHFYHPWVQLFWTFPIGFVVFVSLIPQSSFGKWLEQRWLVTLGKYSYSLYLLHSIVVEMFTRNGEPTTLVDGLVTTLLTFTVSIILSKLLFTLIEAPYFELRKARVIPLEMAAKAKQKVTEKAVFAAYSLWAARRAVMGLSLVLLLMVYFGYRSLSSFFTQSVAHRSQPIGFNLNPRILEVTTTPLRFEFLGDANNLGMITTSVRSEEVKTEGVTHASGTPGEVEIRLYDDQNQQLASTRYRIHEIGESRYHPFGFPVVSDAQGKQFAVEYQIVQEDPARALIIETGDADFRTLYLTNKSELLKNPQALFTFVLNKLTEPFLKPSAIYTMVQLAPFMLLIWIGLFRGRFQEKMVE